MYLSQIIVIKLYLKCPMKKEKTEIEKQYSIDVTTGEVIETEIVSNNKMVYENIIDYLNLRLGTNYKSSSTKQNL